VLSGLTKNLWLNITNYAKSLFPQQFRYCKSATKFVLALTKTILEFFLIFVYMGLSFDIKDLGFMHIQLPAQPEAGLEF
jgi:hypothetical protein